MIRYIHACQLSQFPKLQHSMFRDRATQFKTRLKWEVTVDENGFERDQYDALNPLYIIWEQQNGSHGGSMRFLPTTGSTMVNDFFANIAGGCVRDSRIWETTRFCIAPDTKDGHKIAALLMAAGAQFGLARGLSQSIGVFDARMVRIYRRLGWEPKVLGTEGTGRDAISAGLWSFSKPTLIKLCASAGISTTLAHYWYTRAFEQPITQEAA